MKRQDIGKQSVLKRSKWLSGMGLMMLVLCGWSGALGQVRSGIVPEDIQENVPYRFVIPGSEGAVMALDHSDYSSINNNSYGVVRHTWNAPSTKEQDFYGRKDEVFFFEAVPNTSYFYIKGYFNDDTQASPNYSVQYIYADGWKLGKRTESQFSNLNAQTKENHRFDVLTSVSENPTNNTNGFPFDNE